MITRTPQAMQSIVKMVMRLLVMVLMRKKKWESPNESATHPVTEYQSE